MQMVCFCCLTEQGKVKVVRISGHSSVAHYSYRCKGNIPLSHGIQIGFSLMIRVNR